MWCKYNVKESVGDKVLFRRPYFKFAMFCFTLQEMEAKI